MLALLGGLAVAGSLAELEAAQQELFRTRAPGVVFLSTGDGFGSGFVVHEDGRIVTNAHVVGEAETVAVVLMDGRTLQATVVERAEALDLALIDIDAPDLTPLVLDVDPDRVQVGAWAASIGHGRGGVWTFTTGMISNRYANNKATAYQTQIPVNPGSSGGPVLDRHGRVIGVVTAGLVQADSINYAIPSFEVATALGRLGDLCGCISIQAPKGMPVFLDGKLVGTGPVVRVSVKDGQYDIFTMVGGKRRSKQVRFPDERTVDLTVD